MRQAPKMTDLVIEETSGVDHPAHLHEGWLVVKAANIETEADVLRDLPEPLEEGMAEDTAEATKAEYEDEDMDAAEKGVEEDLAMAQARITELEARIAELEGAAEAEMEPEMEEMVEGLDPATVALAKAADEPVRKMLVDMAKAKREAEIALVKEREDRADAEAIAKARNDFAHLNIEADKIGPALRRLALSDEALAKSVEDALLAANAQSETADIFAELGKAATVESGSAYQKMVSLAKAAVSEGKATSVEQGIALVASTDPALYNEYLTEKGA